MKHYRFVAILTNLFVFMICVMSFSFASDEAPFSLQVYTEKAQIISIGKVTEVNKAEDRSVTITVLVESFLKGESNQQIQVLIDYFDPVPKVNQDVIGFFNKSEQQDHFSGKVFPVSNEAKSIVPELVRKHLRNQRISDQKERENGLRDLLHEELEIELQIVQESALVDLSRILNSSDVQPLIKVLQNQKSADGVRYDALTYLGHLKAADAIPTVKGILENSKSEQLRNQAAAFIGIFNQKENDENNQGGNLEYLLNRLDDEKSPAVREATARSLYGTATHESYQALAKKTGDKDSRVRKYAGSWRNRI